MDNLWLLTEERPKASVVKQIIEVYCQDFSDTYVCQGEIKIKPIINDAKFTFTYHVENLMVEKAENIYIKIVSGSSSFLDYLVFKQENAPEEGSTNDNLIMAIEETKTSDRESRNTGVYQRGTKFVYLKSYYDAVKSYMLYNEEMDYDDNKRPSDTSIFGTNMLLTLGVNIIGKDITQWFHPFQTLNDLITCKNNMNPPPSGNVPIRITKYADKIKISGRLSKPADAGNIDHDPNIGALSTISKCVRELGWDKDIIITDHGVSQAYVDNTHGKNKFLYICHILSVKLEGITMPRTVTMQDQYWHYEIKSEKIASIFLHTLMLYYGLYGVYENHAGCERGYFYDKKGNKITIPKKDTHGVKIPLPDVIFYDNTGNNIAMIEAEKTSNLANGLRQMQYFNLIEDEYVKTNYSGAIISRWICLFGGNKNSYINDKVLIYLNDSGDIFVNPNAPEYIKRIFRTEGINI